MADLIADCRAKGVCLLPSDGGLTIDAPQDVLTPNLLDQLKTHKAEILAILQPNAEVPEIDRRDAAAVLQAALGLLEFDPLFPPELLEALREADVRWDDEPATDVVTRYCPAKPTSPICTCGSTTWLDLAIHEGRSLRRECSRCHKFISFPIWYGNTT